MPGHPYPDESSLDIGLSNWAVEQLMLSRNFVANQISPVIAVPKISGQYFVFVPREGYVIEHQEKVGKGGIATELDFRIEKGFFATEESAKRHFVSDREVANADVAAADYIKGDALVLQNIATIREYELAAQVLDPANYYGGAAGSHVMVAVNPWDSDDSNPKTDIDSAQRVLRVDSGFTGNTLLVPPRVYDALTSNADIKDILKYMGGLQYIATGRIPNDILYRCKIVEASAVYDSAAPLETANLQFLWENVSVAYGDNWAVLMYVDTVPSRKSGTFVSQFAFNMQRISDMDIVSFFIYRHEERRGEYREGRTDYQVKVTNPRAAVLITNVLTDATSG